MEDKGNIKDKVAYLHFAGKIPRGYAGKAIMSIALCTDFHGTNLITSTVEAVDAQTDTHKWIDIQAFNYALDYLYKMQSELLRHHIVKVFIVTDNRVLHSYLAANNLTRIVQKDIRFWLEDIYSSHASFMEKGIEYIGVGLADVTDHNRAKNYYHTKYVENPEMLEQEVKVKKMYKLDIIDNGTLTFGNSLLDNDIEEEEEEPVKKKRGRPKKNG